MAQPLLLLQLVRGRRVDAGWTGTLTVGTAAAFFAASTFMLAELHWVALATLLLVPLAAGCRCSPNARTRLRLVLLALICVCVASATVLAAWLATRSPVP
ncbi:MAG: hypothetical protein IPP44_15255 [Ideonella sp.]|nr:hypothetical protein [Ideonella sp.]